ncbi:MAG: long-chain-fatty-acid--CoA ligase, partial [Thermodesulfobacteriota bacterium]
MDIVKGFPSTMQDDYQLNLINLIKHGVRNADKQEIVCKVGDTMFRHTYADAYGRMMRFANALKGLGIGIGDRIGVMDWNSYRNYEMYFAIPGTGAVMLLMNLRLAPADLAYVVNHAETKLVVVDETLLPLVEAAAPQFKTVQGYVVFTDKNIKDIQTKLSPVYSYEDLLSQADAEYDWPHMDERAACAACYTTGTTGRPKGVYYSHRSTYLHALSICGNSQLSNKDCYFQLVPMFHAMGWGGPYFATLVGAKFVLPGMYNLNRLDELADIMVDEKVTVSAGAPALLLPMLEHIKKMEKKPDFRGARILSGATEPPLSMMKEFWNLTGAEIIHAYGATETSPLASINRLKPWLEETLPEDERWDLRRKQGYVVTGLDVKLLDPAGKEVKRDGESVGEFCLRGPWITGKYYNPEAPTTQFSEDGYWKSGDAGTMDKHGYLKITDRVKDVIKSGGEWISSVDMENAITSHPAVFEATVVGVAHPKWEERPLALVVLSDEFKGKVEKQEILDHLSKTFAKWQLPDEILFVDEFAKTS